LRNWRNWGLIPIMENYRVTISGFSEAQTLSRIDAFIEVVEEKARRRGWMPVATGPK